MGKIRKLKAVRSLVRPDRRDDYRQAWMEYARAMGDLGAQVWLFEDQELPGRYLEFTEFDAAPGMEGSLDQAARTANLRASCIRREGEDVLYREVVGES